MLKLFNDGGDLTVTVWAAVVKVPQLLVILIVILYVPARLKVNWGAAEVADVPPLYATAGPAPTGQLGGGV